MEARFIGMITQPNERRIDLPPNPPRGRLSLAYGYRPGLVLVYTGHVRTHRNSGGGLHYDPIEQDDLRESIAVEVIDHDPVDDGFYIIHRHTPSSHRRGGQELVLTPAHLIYLKQTNHGEIIESSGAESAPLLVLPRMSLDLGSAWQEVEHMVPAHRTTPVEIVRALRVSSIDGDLVTIVGDADPVSYITEPPDGRGAEVTMTEHATIVFHRRWGLVTRQEIDTTVSIREEERRSEMLTSRRIDLTEA